MSEPPGARLHKPVVLIGMMGAGKTAVGRELARILDVPFSDSDAEIERAAAMSVTEIFARDGETFFRNREAEVIARLLRAGPGILAVGGGAWLHPATRALIAELGAALWLKADLELLWARVRRKTTRPLLLTANPRGTLAALLAARGPVYALAELHLDIRADSSIAQTAEAARAVLAGRPDILS